MPSTYNGQRAIASSTTVGSTHTSTIVTVGSHDLISGDVIHIFNDSDDSQLNGTQTVASIVSGDTFTIVNSDFSDGSGVTGLFTIAARTLEGEAITIPSDGDGPGIKAADVDTPLEGLQDAVADLEAMSPVAALIGLQPLYQGSASSSVTAGVVISYNFADTPVFEGDLIETLLSGSVEFDVSSAGAASVTFELWESFNGGSSYTATAACQMTIASDVVGLQTFPFTLTHTSVAVSPVAANAYYAEVKATVSLTSATAVYGNDLNGSIKIWRPL